MYKNQKVKVNGISFQARDTTNYSINTLVGTNGFKKDEARFCLRIKTNPKADMVITKTEDGMLFVGCSNKSLHDFRDALAFALNTVNYQIKEAKNG